MSYRKNLAKAITGCLDLLGINRLARYLNRSKGIILWYHNICPDDFTPSGSYSDMHLPVSEFKKQIQYLKKSGYNFVTLPEMTDKLEHGLSVGKMVTLTFDDGFADIAEVAYPWMKELGAKGCLYVVTDATDSERVLWPDRVALAVDHSPAGTFVFNAAGQEVNYTLDGKASYDRAVSDIIRRLRSLPDNTRRKALDQFPEPHDFPKSLRIVSREQLQNLNRNILELGSHSRSHAECTKLVSQAEFDLELGGSKTDLEKIINYRIDHFCYPSGSFNNRLPARLQQYGYVTAVTTVPGLVDRNSRFLALKRLNGTVDFSLFKALVSGAILPMVIINHWIRKRTRVRGIKV